MQKKTIYVFDNNLNKIALIDDYESCSWQRSAFSSGSCTLQINYNIPNAKNLKVGYFVRFGEDENDFGIITSVQDSIGPQGKGSQKRLFTIKDARYIFHQRTILQFNNSGDSWSMTGKASDVMRELINSQCGSTCLNNNRKFNFINIDTQSIGSEVTVSESGSNLYDVLCTIAESSQLYWISHFNEKNKTLVISFRIGKDLSNKVHMSTDFDALKSGNFVESIDGYANVMTIGGAGNGDERIFKSCFIDNIEPSGLNRFEGFSNNSDLITDEELENTGKGLLKSSSETITVSGQGLAKCPYEYKKDYDVMDIVDVNFSGRKASVKIISVTESWAYNSYSISYEFGKSMKGLSEQMKFVYNKLSVSNSKSTSGTNTSEMRNGQTTINLTSGNVALNNSQVINNIIQINGSFSDTRNVILYFDEVNKIGSKTYTIYANTSGTVIFRTNVTNSSSYTVTLTKGKHFTIYIDDNGNVSSSVPNKTSELYNDSGFITSDSFSFVELTPQQYNDLTYLNNLVNGKRGLIYFFVNWYNYQQYAGAGRNGFFICTTGGSSSTQGVSFDYGRSNVYRIAAIDGKFASGGWQLW